MNNLKKIIWLTGMPRSGTTWVSQIFAASPNIKVKFCPLFSYSFKNAMSESNSTNEWRDFFYRVSVSSDDFMDQIHLSEKGLIPLSSDKNNNPEALLIKSNRQHHLTESLLQKLPEIKFVALVRNPLAVINSWLTNPTEFPSDENPMLQWRTGECRKRENFIGEYWGFDDWLKVTTMHLKLAKKYPDRFFLIRYEEILNAPIDSSQSLFEKLDLGFSNEVKEFISQSRKIHNDNPRSVYKSKIIPDRWKEQLQPEIIKEINRDIYGTELQQFLEDL